LFENRLRGNLPPQSGSMIRLFEYVRRTVTAKLTMDKKSEYTVEKI